MKARIAQISLQITSAAVVLVAWQLIVSAAPRFDFTVGSPFGIAREWQRLIDAGNLWRDLSVTALEAILGFMAGSAIGTVAGLAMWMSKTAFVVARPYLVALGAVPVFALGPVLIFWFGTGIWSKVRLGFLSTFVIALVQAYTGAIEADPNFCV